MPAYFVRSSEFLSRQKHSSATAAEERQRWGDLKSADMLRVGERVLLLALSDECDKHPLGYLSSRLLTDAEGATSDKASVVSVVFSVSICCQHAHRRYIRVTTALFGRGASR